MRIKNATRYPSRRLRTIFTAVHRRLAQHEGPHPRWKGFVFRVIHTRRGLGYSGSAHVGGSSATIRLPRHSADPVEIACLVDHELLHAYGYRHRQMPKYDRAYREQLAWAKVFGTVTEAPEPPRVAKVGLRERRHELVLAGIERWTRRLRVAQGRLKKLRAKDRYYRRALAAARG